MKKYFMTGMAAIVFCGVFTSCSRDMDMGGTVEKDITQTYEEAFKARFGQPASTQNWGFGSASTRAFTREENANANEWADPTKAYGGLKVPPPLTDAQIAVVKKYFQTHPNLGYEDPKWSNYFIQQVYKGHTNVPENCATPEAYMAANGSTYIIASDHMDHLVAVDPDYVDPETGEKVGFYDHINNFNHGDCSTNNDVLTWSPDYVSSANTGPFHSDKIMYMKNSTTKSFGYINSNGSVLRTNYTGLVSFQTIIDDMGAEANCLADGWNRSFMGFDFEQMIDKECYANESEVWENGKLVSATPKELVIWGNYIINGVEQSNYVYQYNGQPVKMLSDQTNRYCGTKRTVSDGDLYTDLYDTNNNNQYIGKQLNTSVIDGLLADGYLPVDNKQLREWIKVGGCADHYFSDWIVTLTKAETTSTPPTPQPGTLTESLRVIAEDLTVDQNTDFDFNDVVFDVTWSRTVDANNNISNSVVTITLKAAGGTLPLYVDGKEVHQLYQENNMTLFINQYTMINTHAEDLSLSGISGLADITWTTTNYTGSTIEDIANSIDVMVKKNGQEIHLAAPVGGIASKIGVKTNYEWCNERQDIEEKYKLIDNTSPFREWVRGIYPANDWYSYAKDEIDKYKANKIAAQAGN